MFLNGSSHGTYYLDVDNLPKTSLAATTQTGRGGFLDITPQAVEIDFELTPSNCLRTSDNWAGNSANRARGLAIAGFQTLFDRLRCD